MVAKKNILSFGCLIVFLFITTINSFSQSPTGINDTTSELFQKLKEVTITGVQSKSEFQKMPDIMGTSIYAGKKSTLIMVNKVQGNIVNNNMRQILSKVAGIHVWESDPSGIQIGIATRGLSPNRSWDFNTRQNGYDIAADPYGYPEAYYNPPMQGVQQIEIIRGQGALQYGPQMGGLINYILKNGMDIHQPIAFETQQTIGSCGLLNSFNAIGGKKKKINYYSFLNYRKGDGWRNNSQFLASSFFNTFTWSINNKLSLTGELMRSHTLSQQPGGLTDSQFQLNPQISWRSRNWFDIKWTTPAISIQYNINNSAKWQTKVFGIIGIRNSVGFIKSILINDSINPPTNDYDKRTLSADKYYNWGIESKILIDYKIRSISNTLSGGIRYYNGITKRQSNGVGNTGSDYNMNATGPYLQDISFDSKNFAFFLENIIHCHKKLMIIPAFRFEHIEGNANGRTNLDINGNPVTLKNRKKIRQFFLGGMGVQYKFKNSTELYTNLSQAYRPIQFSNLSASPTTDSIDPNLSDARGFNWDGGYRGKINNWIQFDISTYILNYENRIGTITPLGNNYRVITNVGNSVSKGIECFVEWNPNKKNKQHQSFNWFIFVSYSYTDARYSKNHKDLSIKGKQIENAPKHICRTGITFNYQSILFTTQYSFVDKTYSDANNTILPSANGQTGLIPSYQITDCTLSFKLKNKIEIKSGVNNVFNVKYFTRRSGSYPGPGVLPGDGRTFFASIGTKF